MASKFDCRSSAQRSPKSPRTCRSKTRDIGWTSNSSMTTSAPGVARSRPSAKSGWAVDEQLCTDGCPSRDCSVINNSFGSGDVLQLKSPTAAPSMQVDGQNRGVDRPKPRERGCWQSGEGEMDSPGRRAGAQQTAAQQQRSLLSVTSTLFVNPRGSSESSSNLRDSSRKLLDVSTFVSTSIVSNQSRNCDFSHGNRCQSEHDQRIGCGNCTIGSPKPLHFRGLKLGRPLA